MITTVRNLMLAAVTAGTLLGGGSAAVAAQPSSGTLYTCDALTSAGVPAVRKQLADQGIDPSTVTGPVGLSCTKSRTDDEGVGAAVTAIEGVAYRCDSAQEKNRTKIIFFVDCAQPTSETE